MMGKEKNGIIEGWNIGGNEILAVMQFLSYNIFVNFIPLILRKKFI